MNKLVQIVKFLEELYYQIILKYVCEGVYILGDDDKNLWVLFGDSVVIKYFCFDVWMNLVVNILWVKGGGCIGMYCYCGVVLVLMFEGFFVYYEYSWVVCVGDFIYELLGIDYMFYFDDLNGVKVIFWINGLIEFYDEKGQYDFMVDVFWFINYYMSYCEEKGILINYEMFI